MVQIQEEIERFNLELENKNQLIEEEREKSNTIKQENSFLLTQLEQVQEELENPSLKEERKEKKEKQENSFVLTQLEQVQEELEKYYLENQKLKENINIKQYYYGAADRIKQDLPYRLGAIIVSYSKSINIFKLPFALVKEYKIFKKNQINIPNINIEEYQDAHEAKKIEKHLSYKLGKTLTDGINSPLKFLIMPIALINDIIEFKKGR